MTALGRLTSMEIKLFFREKQAVFWTFLFPILMIWLFGEMFGKTKIAGMSYSDAYIPSWVAVNLLTTTLFTIGTTLTAYRQTGILRRFHATPLRSWVILSSHMAYGLLVFAISAVVVIVFGKLQFQLDMPKHLGGTLLATLLSILALFPFGLFMASFAKNARTAAAISSLLLNLMLFLSGATFPLEMMPSFYSTWPERCRSIMSLTCCVKRGIFHLYGTTQPMYGCWWGCFSFSRCLPRSFLNGAWIESRGHGQHVLRGVENCGRVRIKNESTM